LGQRQKRHLFTIAGRLGPRGETICSKAQAGCSGYNSTQPSHAKGTRKGVLFAWLGWMSGKKLHSDANGNMGIIVVDISDN
jgi:hypothetical protein